MRDVDKYEDVLDTRDIKMKIEELEQETQELYDEYVDERVDCEENVPSFDMWYEDNINEELDTLRKLYQDCEDMTNGTQYGETLIRESYFSEYTQDLCEDCGYISKDFPSWIEIDWNATAENVKQDYSEIDFDGITYFIRS